MARRFDDLPPAPDDPAGVLIAKLRRRDTLSDAEADILRDAIERLETVPAGRTMTSPGQKLAYSTLLIDGVVGRYKDLRDGQRQVTEVHVAGDFVDLHGFLLKKLDHHIGAMSAVRIAYVPHSKLERISEEQPHLARMLWLSTLIDSSLQRERILSIGRRHAASRIAHLLCELYVRLDVVGKASGTRYNLPIIQADLADVTGLTPVHVNRMLRQLRDEGLVTFRNGIVDIHNMAALERLAEFDRDYLFLERMPR